MGAIRKTSLAVTATVQKGFELRSRKVRRTLQFVNKGPSNPGTGLSILSLHNRSKQTRRISVTSWQTEYGRIDLITEAAHTYDLGRADPECQDRNEEFSALVVLTPAPQADLGKQLLFRGKHQRGCTVDLIGPSTLEIRNIRHNTAEIFKIASSGSVDEMNLLLASGQGSLTDCDECGRPLLSVSGFVSRTSVERFNCY